MPVARCLTYRTKVAERGDPWLHSTRKSLLQLWQLRRPNLPSYDPSCGLSRGSVYLQVTTILLWRHECTPEPSVKLWRHYCTPTRTYNGPDDNHSSVTEVTFFGGIPARLENLAFSFHPADHHSVGSFRFTYLSVGGMTARLSVSPLLAFM